MKIGIMGGSFDPVHNGHIDMAYYCKKEFCLDKIMFLPLGDPPHKKNITDKEIRIKMLEKAIESEENFFLSRIEADRIGKTYTFDTISWLKQNTSDEYFFIIGGDSLNSLHSWYRAEELFEILDFIVVDRCNVDENEGYIRAKKMGARLHMSEHTGLDISSTEVRRKVKNNSDISGDVPNGVTEIIKQYGLYTN